MQTAFELLLLLLRPLHHQMDLKLKPTNEAARMEKKEKRRRSSSKRKQFVHASEGG